MSFSWSLKFVYSVEKTLVFQKTIARWRWSDQICLRIRAIFAPEWLHRCLTVWCVGCTLVPGLIDAHVHSIDEVQTLRESLRFGVKTVLGMDSEPVYLAKMQRVAPHSHGTEKKQSKVILNRGIPATRYPLCKNSDIWIYRRCYRRLFPGLQQM